MKFGSLCSGIGGLELGLQWAGLGEAVWQVEIDPFCRRILSKHWPKAKLYDDVHKVGKRNLESVDLICFGAPCQDISSAGTQSGLSGSRSRLFYECARVVAELLPEWVVVENVASGAKLWVDACCAELERLGYACLPVPLSARDVGALHIRARIFIVAHADRERQRALAGLAEVAGASETSGESKWAREGGREGGAETVPTLLASHAKQGHAPPQNSKAGRSLASMIPTLTKSDNKRGLRNNSPTKEGGPNLMEWIGKRVALPTLTKSSYGSSNNGTRDGETPFNLRGKPSLNSLAGGSLSPTWCEWLMGFPKGWTLPGTEHHDLPLFARLKT